MAVDQAVDHIICMAFQHTVAAMALADLVNKRTELIEYKDEATGQVFEALVARDVSKNGRLPVVLVFHTFAGRTEFEDDKASLLADLGYIGFSADLYGKGIRGSTREANMNLMKPLLDDRPGTLLTRLKLSVDAARKLPYVDPGRVAAIGYCFGGLCALDLARNITDPIHSPLGVVSLHGLLNKAPSDESSVKIHSKILALHGYADPHVPREQILAFGEEMTERGADWQLHAYGKAMHSFTNPKADDVKRGVKYDADADRRSWEATRYFLRECLS